MTVQRNGRDGVPSRRTTTLTAHQPAMSFADGNSDRLADDLDAIRAVPEGVGQTLLMVDFNHGLSLDRALRRLRELDDERRDWFEEPIAYHDLAECAVIGGNINTPPQLGESFRRRRNAELALRV